MLVATFSGQIWPVQLYLSTNQQSPLGHSSNNYQIIF
jgi:hypothetical protein